MQDSRVRLTEAQPTEIERLTEILKSAQEQLDEYKRMESLGPCAVAVKSFSSSSSSLAENRQVDSPIQL